MVATGERGWDGPRWITVDLVRAEHGRLLALEAEAAKSGAALEFLPAVRAFVAALGPAGALFDEPSERKALQGYLDYWASELADKTAADAHATFRFEEEIGDFDEEALRQLQDTVENPFSALARSLAALDDDDRQSAAGVL
jgi:hypothetical protein